MANELATKRDVQAEIKARIARQLSRDVRTVALADHILKDDEELDALKLTARQKRVVREWEKPKKSISYALETAAKRFEALLKAQAEAKKAHVHVENMTIQLPEKRADALEPVIIDVEVK